jgi:hypothetical protein
MYTALAMKYPRIQHAAGLDRFASAGAEGRLFDTALPGNANTGHLYGTDKVGQG